MNAREGLLPADHHEARASTVRAVLEWWALAGVDTPVAARPRSWLLADPPGTLQRAKPPRPAPRVPESRDDFARFQSVADFHAYARKRWPGAPLFDGVAEGGIVVVGEAPSAADLETGRPFTGPAGMLLDRMLDSIGLNRQRCGITLVAPLRPAPGPPRPEDIEADLPFTKAHLRLLAPRAILLLGATAARVLTGEAAPISALRGRPQQVVVGGCTALALATFNPAYLLRRPEDKKLAWADLLAFRALLAEKGLA
ncbi:uracil-DNA glycosylase [Thermaurantiacus sp.]